MDELGYTDKDRAIKPAIENDVQEIVKIANANGISFLTPNGGHGAGIGYADISGMVINLSKFYTFSIDVNRNELTVGAGVLIGDLIQPLYDAGLAGPHGNEAFVGMIGATLSGGIGVGRGVLDLGVDSLKFVRLVTAAENMVTASSTSQSELFWAVRGAGANFGIILSATFELQNQINEGNIVQGSSIFAGADNSSVFELYKSFDEDLPDELAITLGLSYNQTREASEIQLTYYYFGPQSEAQPYLDAVQVSNPLTGSISVLTTPQLYQRLENWECTTAYGDEGPAAWWLAANLPKIRLSKALWDPKHLFRVTNPIPDWL
ncbi:hypothetical protein N7493_007342 [Penicillium malachiteum]|uniref:FAD-binding PCMH-type domain-containing protein n=1 Tax=Penicillium malachiteum TaxID=1324776 RepID=A0AAD6HJC7_9EURO|nr:hypothetical protein N7493_007342 [Penicillium malachiteum]